MVPIHPMIPAVSMIIIGLSKRQFNNLKKVTFQKKQFHKEYLKGMNLPNKWDGCYCTADIYFNFVSWYL